MAYIGLDRGIVDHWIYQDAEYFKVWFEMLHRARFAKEPHIELVDGEMVTVNYSEFIYGRIKWSQRLKVSEQRLRTLIKKLKTDEMIEVVSEHRKCTLYRIKNYAKFNQQSNQQETQVYQGFEQHVNQQSNQSSTSSQPAVNHESTTKEEGSNKEKNVKKEKKDKKEYVDYVFLTETEYAKLTELLGEDERDNYFLRFASWISGQTKRVQQNRSAYLTILNWHKESQQSKPKPVFQQQLSGYQKTKSRLDQMLAEEEAKKDGARGYNPTGTDTFR
ncbi:hypothetical protein BBD42_13045 [Paenibacillus sp. BIHB 4019]|uniref:DnaD domain-containing protein n=1 Tax=Paenibacillus sp. BIHB 4019 TaxID=1870819 RepID=A0A1B2DHU0_9BACL|nr:hypothetical protein [Paenibacillus sp. BIHB 4019]ANY67297.1 hypothetical protein BBD42_13045 [Paenibacillus sp. BIHB 4019]